jgi:hypothetical protein
MRFLLLILWSLTLPLLAVGGVDFHNDREGESFYHSKSNQRAIKRALRDVDERQILSAFDDVSQTTRSSKLCSFDFYQAIENNLKNINPDFNHFDGAVYFLRSQNKIDDVVVKLLLVSHRTINTNVRLIKHPDEIFLPNQNTVDIVLPLITSFKKKYYERACLDNAYTNLYNEILNADKRLKPVHFEALYYEAYRKRLIDTATYEILEKARINELQTQRLSLQSYNQKILSLRTQFPLRDIEEKSTFVTEKISKTKISRRQHLLENYTDIQIMMMGNVIKKLRTRLESPKAEILIYDKNQGIESITLEPMERFRLAVKLLRKEMAYLSLNTYFEGRSPDYMDLITASYETGIIAASELDELAGLQDIWNPKKSFWDKSRVWIQTFSSVATIALPPPYGFIPALAIVVIEATAGKKKETNQNDPTSLF